MRGDVTLMMDNVAEPVILTRVEIEGAESLGKFDNFQLDPGQPATRGMRLHFRGKAPAGNEPYTVSLVFKDLRGNRCPPWSERQVSNLVRQYQSNRRLVTQPRVL